jgi:hypothetical protein
MNIIDLIQRRRNIVFDEGEGISLITKYVNKYEGREFYFKGLRKKYFKLSHEELLKKVQREIDSMLILYRYHIHVKEYTDRKGMSQCAIKILGRAGMFNRYNMLNIELSIKTEK